jgi:hypothetical protein
VRELPTVSAIVEQEPKPPMEPGSLVFRQTIPFGLALQQMLPVGL